jgi:hypothetical protein
MKIGLTARRIPGLSLPYPEDPATAARKAFRAPLFPDQSREPAGAVNRVESAKQRRDFRPRNGGTEQEALHFGAVLPLQDSKLFRRLTPCDRVLRGPDLVLVASAVRVGIRTGGSVALGGRWCWAVGGAARRGGPL